MEVNGNNNYDLILINTPPRTGTNTIRLGLLTIASYTKRHGFSIKLLDGNLRSIKNQIVNLSINNNTVFGLTATTDVVLIAYELCKFIKEKHPNAFCILGGFHATALPEQTIKESEFDLVVFGEGELTLLDILNVLKTGGVPEDIPGTVSKKNGTITKNKPRELINDLDILPMPAYDLIQIENHFGGIRYEKVVAKRCLLLLVSRGCPFDCVFCDSKIMWKRRLRWNSMDYVIELIKYAVKNFNIDGIQFLDDELICNKDRIISLTENLIKTGLAEKLKWECQGRVKSVNEELLMKLKEAGCQLIRFGIESGSPKSLAFLKSGTIKVEDCYNAVQLCKKVGLPSFGSFIIGAPEEDVEDIIQTIEFIENCGLSGASVFVATPYPGTGLFNICKEKGYLAHNITWSDYLVEGEDVNPIIRNKNFTAQQLKQIRNYITINVVNPLNRGLKPQRLDHRKELGDISRGKLNRTRESFFGKTMNYWRKGIDRPDRIMPFIKRKIERGVEKIRQ